MLPWYIVTSRRVLTNVIMGFRNLMRRVNITTCVNYMLAWDTETSCRGLAICYHGILKLHTEY